MIYNSAGTAGLWATNTNANGNRLELWDNGLIVIFRTVWSSNTSQGTWVGSMAQPGCSLGNILGKTGVIGQGQCFASPNGRYELILQPDGNLVLYDRLNSPVSIWSTNTSVTLSPGVALVTLYNYDALGNLLCVEQHGDATTGTGCSSTPSNDTTSPWRVRRFTYDSFSRLLTAHNPESGTITYSYDADGNLLQKTSPMPNQTGAATQTVSFCYDALHRVTGKGYGTQSCPLSSPVVTYAYDSGLNGKGKLTSLVDQAGTASYTYDILGRMATETRTLSGVGGAISKNLSYEYNLDGSLAKLHYPSGAVVTYTPDSAGRTVSAIDSGNGINYATSAAYGPDGSLTSFISGHSATFAGISNAYTYNKRLQPVTMSATAPSQTLYSIGYDFHVGNGTTGADNGNVFGIINYKDTTHNRDQTFTYDVLNRLTSAQNAGTDCTQTTVNGLIKFWGNTYGYDAWGNLLSKTKISTACAGESLSVTVAANNRLGGGYLYDSAGNMTFNATPPTQTYTYDQENRITGANGFTYTYDSDGNRVRKSNGTLAANGTLYWYMTPGIVAESDLAGTTTSEYVFFGGERVARRDGVNGAGGVFYYFSDHLKTASVITDAAGIVKAESDYYPWGGELQFTNNDSNHYKFTGKERDSETGLDYFGARYYSNGLARWVSADWSPTPIPVPYADFGDPQSLNLYQFVGGNPASKADPDGHDAMALSFDDYKAAGPFGIHIPFTGHSALVTIDSKGHTRGFEYGRYDKAQKGIVRNLKTSDVTMKNGKPTEASMKKLLGGIAKQEHDYKGTISGAYYKMSDANTQKVDKYATDREAQNSDSKRVPYNLGITGTANNCGTFARDGVAAGGTDISKASGDARPESIISDMQKGADTKITYDANKNQLTEKDKKP